VGGGVVILSFSFTTHDNVHYAVLARDIKPSRPLASIPLAYIPLAYIPLAYIPLAKNGGVRHVWNV
jgi:hypothetical protein